MLKKFFAVLTLILALNFSVTDAAVQPVTDQAGLMSTQEVDALNQKIRDVQQAHKIKIGVVFVKSLGGRDPVRASDELLNQNFANSINGSILLLVDINERRYEIATNPLMSERITTSDGIATLKDTFKSSLSGGDYYGAVNNFVDGVDELMTYYETNGAPYGTRSAEGFDPMAAFGAVVVALFIGVTIRSWLISSMSNIRHVMTATDYLKRDTVKLTENRNTFLFRNIKRRPKSGGGSRGGGGHSGGGGGGSF